MPRDACAARAIYGVGADMARIFSMRVAIGRFLAPDDPVGARAFVVLGAKLERELFGNANSLGERVRIGDERFPRDRGDGGERPVFSGSISTTPPTSDESCDGAVQPRRTDGDQRHLSGDDRRLRPSRPASARCSRRATARTTSR